MSYMIVTRIRMTHMEQYKMMDNIFSNKDFQNAINLFYDNGKKTNGEIWLINIASDGKFDIEHIDCPSEKFANYKKKFMVDPVTTRLLKVTSIKYIDDIMKRAQTAKANSKITVVVSDNMRNKYYDFSGKCHDSKFGFFTYKILR